MHLGLTDAGTMRYANASAASIDRKPATLHATWNLHAKPTLLQGYTTSAEGIPLPLCKASGEEAKDIHPYQCAGSKSAHCVALVLQMLEHHSLHLTNRHYVSKTSIKMGGASPAGERKTRRRHGARALQRQVRHAAVRFSRR